MRKQLLLLKALLVAALLGVGMNAWGDPLYSWVGGTSSATETGGTATGTFSTHTTVAGTFYTMTIAGSSSDLSTGGMTIELTSALQAGDIIRVTGFQDINASDKVTALYMSFDEGSTNKGNISDTENWVNLNTTENCATGTAPDLKTYTVTAALAGSNKITLIRTNGKTGTNLFINKIQIVRPVVNANISCTGTISNGVLAGTVNSMTIGTGGAETSIVSSSYMKLGDHSNTVTIPSVQRAGTRDVVTVSFDMAWGNKLNMGSGIALKDADGATIAYFDKARWGSEDGNMGIIWSNILGSHSNNQAVWNNKTHFVITVNYASKLITTKATLGNTTETFTVSMTNTNPIATFAVRGYGAGSNADRASLFGNLNINTTEGDYSVSSANYTVNWVCNSSTVKTATRTGDVGSTISLLGTDDDSFFVSETKYMYVSDNAEGKTVANDGSTVVTITVKEPAVYNYTVKAIDNDENVLSTIASSSVYEDDNTATTNIPWFVLKDATLYYQNGTNSNTTSITGDNQVINITYVANKTNVVYYAEAENIGGNWITNSNSSNNRAAKDLSSVKFTTLPAGKYKIYSRFVVGNGTSGNTYATNPFTIGDAPLAYNVPAKTNTDYTSEDFFVTESTDLYVTFSGSSISGVDYIYIQKTGDVVNFTLGADAGDSYKSYVTKGNTDFATLGVTAYIAKAADTTNGKVTLSTIATAPANTPVLLKGTKGEYATISTTTTSYDAPETNYLKAADGETAIGSTDAKYVLAYNSGWEFRHYDGTLSAGKVYLDLSTMGARATKFNFVFDDETTGIEDAVKSEETKDKSFYNLSGQRVKKATKGLYIKNGKKVVIK